MAKQSRTIELDEELVDPKELGSVEIGVVLNRRRGVVKYMPLGETFADIISANELLELVRPELDALHAAVVMRGNAAGKRMATDRT